MRIVPACFAISAGACAVVGHDYWAAMFIVSAYIFAWMES